jgi:3-hydroxyacyl-CoA dehydrogenase/3a,7a,12a-trihydroxy-5b-cholest-24-enoyl-CoA hydratase
MSSNQLRFDGKVAIVTGAGLGLGRAYATLLASRGAKVLVNELGCDVNGKGNSQLADEVVAEIKKAGGVAVANYDSAEHGEKIVKHCVEVFGTVDIVINNAGILRDVSFTKMTDEDWDLIYRYHTKATYSVTKAAWPILFEKKYGRVITTGSSAGIYGAFGQANYSTAKMGFFGFTQTLAKEGDRRNIKVNCIAPLAASRMTKTVMPDEMLEVLKPEYVAAFVAVLCHDECPDNGAIYQAGGGYVCKLRFQRSTGQLLKIGQITPENFLANYDNINDFETNVTYPDGPQDLMEALSPNLEAGKTANEDLKANETFGMMKTYLS